MSADLGLRRVEYQKGILLLKNMTDCPTKFSLVDLLLFFLAWEIKGFCQFAGNQVAKSLCCLHPVMFIYSKTIGCRCGMLKHIVFLRLGVTCGKYPRGYLKMNYQYLSYLVFQLLCNSYM